MATSWHGHQTFLTATHKNQSTLSRYTTCERLTEGQMDTEIDNQQLWLKTETYRSEEPEETGANILLVPNYCTIRVLWLNLLKTKLLNDKYWYRNLEAFTNFLQVNRQPLVWVLISNLFMLLLRIQVENQVVEFEKSCDGRAWFIIITIIGKPYDWNPYTVLNNYSTTVYH